MQIFVDENAKEYCPAQRKMPFLRWKSSEAVHVHTHCIIEARCPWWNHFQKKREGDDKGKRFYVYKMKRKKWLHTKNMNTRMRWSHISDYLRVFICNSNMAFLDCAYTAARPVVIFETKMSSEVGLLQANTDQTLKNHESHLNK